MVGGTEGVTIENAPDNVGRLDGRPESLPAAVEPVMVGIDCVFVPVAPEPVITTFEAVSVPVVFAEPVFVAVDRLGRAESVAAVAAVAAADCAAVPIVRREIARAVERRGVFDRSLMMNILPNCRVKR